ncbi:hypothetical protein [Nocardiopsis metallicus]|uniref:hypothetical protein n=1 Tax=Nocardiopsis metallicus TaxID=179819 RepID=UPI00161DFAD6|nr:hypothetical protein [Nocardiopsis metallicus]
MWCNRIAARRDWAGVATWRSPTYSPEVTRTPRAGLAGILRSLTATSRIREK